MITCIQQLPLEEYAKEGLYSKEHTKHKKSNLKVL